MPRRFFCPQPLDVPRLTLSDAESHHLLRVLRVNVGERVTLFDGAGREATAILSSAANGLADLEIVETRSVDCELPAPIILATAVPKGDRFSWLVEKAVELGVSKLVPLRSARSIVDPGEGKLQRMRQVVVAASKQCGRSRLMEIAEVRDWADFLRGRSQDHSLLVADPSGDDWPAVPSIATPVILCVGPEGGFTPAELSTALDIGAIAVNLGPRILRIETAAIAMAVRGACWSSRFSV